MLYTTQGAEKFMSKLSSDPACFCVKLTTTGNLAFESCKKVHITDFIVICDGQLWGRSGMVWLPSSALPEKPVPLCMLSLKRLAIFLKDEMVDCISPKKAVDPGTSFLLCAKFTSGIRLLIADPSIGAQHIALTFHRDENGEAFCRALIRQFVKHRLPDQLAALDVLLKGGDTE